ncbi:MAG TPA: hypothetical protein GXZ21_06825 [Clostridiales bacterium]|nr:hypothetical protein [Clostridiales bacterium]
MSRQYLRSRTMQIQSENIKIVYHLYFNNTQYSIECYREGHDYSNPNNYSVSNDFTDDEGVAVDFLHRVAKGKVSPVHINDLVKDYIEKLY